jgi:hypothetical protein
VLLLSHFTVEETENGIDLLKVLTFLTCVCTFHQWFTAISCFLRFNHATNLFWVPTWMSTINSYSLEVRSSLTDEATEVTYAGAELIFASRTSDSYSNSFSTRMWQIYSHFGKSILCYMEKILTWMCFECLWIWQYARSLSI